MINLKCTGMVKPCNENATHIDRKGFIYCKSCAYIRKAYMQVRQLKLNELTLLKNNRPIAKY